MNANATNTDFELSQEQVTEVEARLERDFTQNPEFLRRLDTILTNNATAHHNTRSAKLTPDGTVIENQLHLAFGSLNELIDGWVRSFPLNEQQQIRDVYYKKLTARIKSKLTDKKTSFQAKVNLIESGVPNSQEIIGANSLYRKLSDLQYGLRTNIDIIHSTPSNTGPIILGPELEAIATGLATLNPRDLYEGLYRTAPPPPEVTLTGHPTIVLNSIASIEQLRNLVIQLLEEGLFDLHTETAALVPTETVLQNAKAAIIALQADLKARFDGYITNLQKNLVHPDTSSRISFQVLEQGASILDEYEKVLKAPGVDIVFSRDERFTNFIPVLNTNTNPNTYDFYHPQRTPNPTLPFTRGAEMLPQDIQEFLAWYQKNKAKLSPEQIEAVEHNAQLSYNTNVEAYLNSETADMTTPAFLNGHSADQIKHLAKQRVVTRVATLNASQVQYACITLGIDGANLTANQLRARLVSELQDMLIDRLNLPSDDDLAEFHDTNQENYAQTVNTFTRTGIDQARNNMLSTTRSKVAVDLNSEFKDKNLRNPKNAKEFTSAAASKILQARLDTLSKITSPDQNRWYKNIPAKLGLDTQKMTFAGGAFGISALSLGMVNYEAVGSFISNTASSLTSWIGAQTPAIIPSMFKYVGTASSAVGGYLAGQQFFNFLSNGPGSDSRVRTKNEVLGTIDDKGRTTGGLGDLDARAGTYTHTRVQSALAAQLAQAEKLGATFAKTHSGKSTDLIQGGPQSLSERFNTADYLWQREQQGLEAVIKNQLNIVLRDTTIPNELKNEVAISRAMNVVYSSGGIEESFHRQYAQAKRYNSNLHFAGKFGFGPACGLAAGTLFAAVL